MSDNLHQPYQPLKSISIPAITGLAVIAALNFLVIVFSVVQMTAPGWNLNLRGRYFPAGFLLISVAASLRFLVYIFTVVFFLIWLNRANKNLAALGAANKEFSSGWAVGWWFVPFANLIKPFQVVREVWNESEPEIGDSINFLASGVGAPGFMVAWWTCWLISNVCSSVAGQLPRIDPVGSAGILPYFFIVSSLLSIIAGALAIKIVIGITGRQEERSKNIVGRIADYQAPPAPPTFS